MQNWFEQETWTVALFAIHLLNVFDVWDTRTGAPAVVIDMEEKINSVVRRLDNNKIHMNIVKYKNIKN